MNIKEILKSLVNVQAMKYKVASQKGRVTKLENRVGELQYLVKKNILTLTEGEAIYVGNKYDNYADAVAEIDKKYNGTAEWGVLQTGNIIDLRAAFIINEGIKVVNKTAPKKKKDDKENKKVTVTEESKDGQAEIEWVERFLAYNDLDKEVAQEFAKEAEIEGKIAIKLALEPVDEEKKDFMVSARYLSWQEKQYKIITDPKDYLQYKQLTWQPKDSDKAETLEEKDFVYKKFGGRINRPNEAAPKIMKCLTQVEGLDKALRDWREINRIFAAPILNVTVKDAQEAKLAQEALDNKNWKLKKIFVSTAEMKYAQFDVGGVTSLENEIITLVKMISGTTGVTVQYLGMADLLKNRSTSQDLREMLVATTMKERETWIGAYEEIITKAMTMYNEEVNAQMSDGAKLDPSKIGIEIPLVTPEEWEHIVSVFLPATLAGKLSDETFLEQIPGLDVEKELERKKEREESELEETKQKNKDLEKERFDKGLFGGGKPGEEE